MEEIDLDVFLQECEDGVNMPSAFQKVPNIDELLNSCSQENLCKAIRERYTMSNKSARKLYEYLLHEKDNWTIETVTLASIFLSKEQCRNLINAIVPTYRCNFERLVIAAGETERYLNYEVTYKYNLWPRDRVRLIVGTGKPEEYLNENIVVMLALNCDDINEIIYAIENREDFLDARKLELLGYKHVDIKLLIKKCKDYRFMEAAIERAEELGLNQSEIELYTNIVKVSKKICNLQDKEKNSKNTEYNEISAYDELAKKQKADISKLTIPEDLRFGIEIESFGGLYWLHTEDYFMESYNWTVKDELSIDKEQEGFVDSELTSPVLTGSREDSENQITNICECLNDVGQKVDNHCGGHIHIDSKYLTNVHAYQNLIDLWCNNEKLLYIISNEAGAISRPGIVKYAKPISKILVNEIKEGSVDFSDNQSVEGIKNQLMNFQELTDEDFEYKRYTGINFSNLGKSGTIEFRVPNGTLNPNVWIQNVNLFGGLVKVAQELSLLQEKDINDLTADELHKLEIFETMKTEHLYEEEKLELLLELVIPEENREIYKERFYTNREYLSVYTELEDQIDSYITQEKVNLSPDVIGKRCFTGSNCLTTEELHVVDEYAKKQNREEYDECEVDKRGDS